MKLKAEEEHPASSQTNKKEKMRISVTAYMIGALGGRS